MTNPMGMARGAGSADSRAGTETGEEFRPRFADVLDSMRQTSVAMKSTSPIKTASSLATTESTATPLVYPGISSQNIPANQGVSTPGNELPVSEHGGETTTLVSIDINRSDVEIPGGSLPGLQDVDPDPRENVESSNAPLQDDSSDSPQAPSQSNQSSIPSQFDKPDSPVEPGPLTEQSATILGGNTFISSFDAALVQPANGALNQSTVAETPGRTPSLAKNFQNGAGKTITHTGHNQLPDSATPVTRPDSPEFTAHPAQTPARGPAIAISSIDSPASSLPTDPLQIEKLMVQSSASVNTSLETSGSPNLTNTHETVDLQLAAPGTAPRQDPGLELPTNNEQPHSFADESLDESTVTAKLTEVRSGRLSQPEMNGNVASTTTLNRPTGRQGLDPLQLDSVYAPDSEIDPGTSEPLTQYSSDSTDFRSTTDHAETPASSSDFQSQLTNPFNAERDPGPPVVSSPMDSLPIESRGGPEQIALNSASANNPWLSTLNQPTHRINPMTVPDPFGFDVQSVDIAEQVVQGLRSRETIQQLRTEDQTIVRMELDPPELGSLSVEIKRTQDVTRVHIVADQSLAHSLLEKNVDSLVQSFRESSDHSFEVDVSHRDTNQQNQREPDDSSSHGVNKIRPDNETQQTVSHSDSSTATGINMIV